MPCWPASRRKPRHDGAAPPLPAENRCYVKKFTYDVIFFTYDVIFFTYDVIFFTYDVIFFT